MRIKTFTHCVDQFQLNNHKIKRFTDNTGRRKYLYESGPLESCWKNCSGYSVTTILDSIHKPELEAWKKAVGEEEATRQAGIAARQGSSLHQAIEAYLNNMETFPDGTMPNVIDLFRRIQPVLDHNLDNIKHIECPLFGAIFDSAEKDNMVFVGGTCDCIAYFDNELSIIDFKNSSNPKSEKQIENYFLQEAAYSMMYGLMTGQTITNLVTIIACETLKEPQIFIKKSWNYIDKFKVIAIDYTANQL